MPPPDFMIKKLDMSPLERVLEAWTRDYVRKELNGIAYKLTTPGNAHVPDRMILLPGGVIVFIELKRKGRKPTPKQLAEHARIRSLGFRVEVCDSKESVRAVLDAALANLSFL